ncbi:hypothetical protein [Hymenobacter chitinivorans]|uniref:YD repeat-containing protein n=1 Tax=Hymenobacter chitinivorans DSM 11115 TaxID=1121954 RepID=A0A2M9ARW4_9BACT|nr:hypothetical protein [Hymenobacter chitinivorans]PJJ48442.1 YD repeat-containing protein [Hymenobacter chitinivorans DSM 11115]
MRACFFLTLLLVGLTAAAQQPSFEDSAAVRRAHLRAVRVVSDYHDEEDGRRVRYRTVNRFARSGTPIYSADSPRPQAEANQSTVLPRIKAVKDALGRVIATRFYQDGKWYYTHHAVWNDRGQKLREYGEAPADSTDPASFYATNFYSYDEQGNFTEQVDPRCEGCDRFTLGTRYRYWYNAQHRLVAKLRYDDLIVPVELDSMYYDAAGNMTRRASYNLRRGGSHLLSLDTRAFDGQKRLVADNSLWLSEVRELSRYDGANRYTPRTGPEQPNIYGLRIIRIRYRPDGQPRQETQYTATRLLYLAAEANLAVQYPPDSLFRPARYAYQVPDIKKERTTYRYNARGYLAQRTEASNSRPDTIFRTPDVQSATRWQYDYYD